MSHRFPDGTARPAGTAAVEDLVLSEVADARMLGRWRRAVASWVEAAGGGPDLVEIVVLAVNEAASNAVEHAYRGRPPGHVGLRAGVAAGPDGVGLVVEISDRGGWQPPALQSSHRGRGLAMLGTLADRVERASTSTGTTVTMAWTGLGARRSEGGT
jgi:anti-sigma regulatory factor (Ser/Thr protein kinase)